MSITRQIEPFLAQYKTKGYRLPSPETIKSYRNALTRYEIFLDGQDPSETTQRDFIERLIATKSSGYARISYYATNALHKWLGIDTAGIYVAAAEPRIVRISDAEIASLIKACLNDRERAVILVLFESGVRAKELLGMTWDKTDLVKGFATITRKGGHVGDVPLFDRSVDALKVLSKRPYKGTMVFPFGYSDLYNMVKRVGERVNMHLTPHMLRHARGGQLRSNGIALDRIQELLGHTDPKTTSRFYAHLTPHQLKEDIKKVG